MRPASLLQLDDYPHVKNVGAMVPKFALPAKYPAGAHGLVG